MTVGYVWRASSGEVVLRVDRPGRSEKRAQGPKEGGWPKIRPELVS